MRALGADCPARAVAQQVPATCAPAAVHALLRRSARLRAAPVGTCGIAADSRAAAAAPATTQAAETQAARRQDGALRSAGQAAGGGASATPPPQPPPPQPHLQQQQDAFDLRAALAQAAPHEWEGLAAWRAKGIDRRLRWGPPDGAAPAGPALVPPQDAPTLASAAPPGSEAPRSLVEAGLLVLRTADPSSKAALTHAAFAAYLAGQLPLRTPASPPEAAAGGVEDAPAAGVGGGAGDGASSEADAMPERPARPDRPRLVRPKEIPGHEACHLGLSGYVLHNLAHIELNAIDLAWDTVVRFAPLGLPSAFYEDFARVADDEARHLGWCLQRMGELGCAYGDMDAHDLLWQGCQQSALDLGARLAVVPMSQEARGLDAGARLVQRLVGVGDVRSSQVVALIAAEERAHVAVGVAWFARTCAALGLPPGPLFRQWLLHLNPDLLKGPYNHRERETVGLPREWYDPSAWPSSGITLAEATSNNQHSHTDDTLSSSNTVNAESSGSSSLGAAPAAAAVRPPGKPARGAPHPRLGGEQPVLSGEQLERLARRLAAWVEAEGAAAARG